MRHEKTVTPEVYEKLIDFDPKTDCLVELVGVNWDDVDELNVNEHSIVIDFIEWNECHSMFQEHRLVVTC